MVSKLAPHWPIYIACLLSSPLVFAANRCDQTLTEIAAHQVLRTDRDAAAIIQKYKRTEGLAPALSDFSEGVISADGSTAVIISQMGFRIWDVKAKHWVGELIRTDVSSELALANDGSQVVGMIRKKGVTVWDTRSGRVISQHAVAEIGDPHKFSPDGKTLLLVKAREDKSPKPGDQEGPPLTSDEIVAAYYKKISYEESELNLIDSGTGKIIRRLRDHKSKFRNAHFSHDGKWIATTSDDGLIRCENTTTGEVKVAYGTGEKTDTVEFSPEGNSLFVVPRTGNALVLPIDGSNKPTPVPAIWGEVYDGAFSPGSKNLLALLTDSGFHLVDGKSFKEKISIRGLEEGLSRLQFSSDGNYFLLSLDDGKRFVVCDVATARPLYELKGASADEGFKVSHAEKDGVIGVSFSNDALKIWETQKITATTSPDAKSFATADGAYRFYRESQPDGSVTIKVKLR